MAEEKISQKSRSKKIDKIRNHFNEKINQNNWMSKKHKNAFMALNYIEQTHILLFATTVYVSISAVSSLVDIPICIASSTA